MHKQLYQIGFWNAKLKPFIREENSPFDHKIQHINWLFA